MAKSSNIYLPGELAKEKAILAYAVGDGCCSVNIGISIDRLIATVENLHDILEDADQPHSDWSGHLFCCDSSDSKGHKETCWWARRKKALDG